ncbi:MAG: DUF6305 family protein, partial [Acidaminococcales bacterium]|nr:DUF6305 family protein [Acidaminococcales bacterium]
MKKPKIILMLCLFALTVFSGVLPARAATFEGPVLIVSIGQSADSQMVKVLAERNGLAYTFNPAAG